MCIPHYHKIDSLVLFLYVAVQALSCGTQNLRSSLWHVGSLVATCGIKFADQGLNPVPLHWEHGILAREVPIRFKFHVMVKDFSFSFRKEYFL